MYLKSLSLANYKNIIESDIDFLPKINCILGNNGEGKTNVLDAIYYLSFCKSYTNSIDSQNINHEEEYFVISGEYERNESIEKIYCGLQRKRSKQFKRNKKKYAKLSEHIGLLPLVMVSPIDNKLLLDGSDERRKYIDGVISQFDKQYLVTLISYNKILTQRNSYLKQGYSPYFDDDLVAVWDEQLNTLGAEIFKKREAFIKELIPIFQKYYSFISADRE
jgi:DNA replication and repair protein RecF